MILIKGVGTAKAGWQNGYAHDPLPTLRRRDVVPHCNDVNVRIGRRHIILAKMSRMRMRTGFRCAAPIDTSWSANQRVDGRGGGVRACRWFKYNGNAQLPLGAIMVQPSACLCSSHTSPFPNHCMFRFILHRRSTFVKHICNIWCWQL
jgi:hypothetical protein